MTDNFAADATPDTSTPAAAGVWLFATFRVSSTHPVVLDGRDVPGVVRELEDVVALVEREGVSVRGWYDVTGFRSDADVLVWLTAATVDDLQWGYRELRRAELLRALVRSGSAVAAAGAALAGDPGSWLAVVDAAVASSAGTPAVDVSGGRMIEAVEADSADELFTGLQGRSAAPLQLGRLIAPVELVEVLQ